MFKPSPRPCQVSGFLDGGLYELPRGRFRQSNLFLEMCRIDDAFVKVPSFGGLDYHNRYLWSDVRPDHPIRFAEAMELKANIADAFVKYPAFVAFADLSRDIIIDVPSLETESPVGFLLQRRRFLQQIESLTVPDARLAHYLLIHRLHYERLREIGWVGIPESRFCYFQRIRSRFFGFGRPTYTVLPGIVQQPVRGTALWNMYKPALGDLADSWKEYRGIIARQIEPLLQEETVHFYDWNPKNFILDSADGRVWYVDSKPTTFAGREENQHNLYGIRSFFLRR